MRMRPDLPAIKQWKPKKLCKKSEASFVIQVNKPLNEIEHSVEQKLKL